MGVRWKARTKFDSKNQWTETSDDDPPLPPLSSVLSLSEWIVKAVDS